MSSLSEQLLALIVTDISTTDQPLEADTDLLLSGIVDSLGVVRIVQWLEERTGMVVDAADVTLENFQTVTAIVGYLDQRRDAVA